MNDLNALYDEYLRLSKGDDFDRDTFNNYAVVHHANVFEDFTLTIEDTFLLLGEKLTPKIKPLERTLMAVDHHDVLYYIPALAKARIPLDTTIIKSISAKVIKGLGINFCDGRQLRPISGRF